VNRKLRWFAELLPSLLALFPSALGEGSPIEQSSLREAPCYAFLKANAFTDSDLYVTCKGKIERITNEKDLGDFAVSSDGTAVGLLRHRGREKGSDSYGTPVDLPHQEIEVVSLDPGFQRRSCPRDEGNTELDASCGTVLAVSHAMWGPSGGFKQVHTTRDTLSGKRLSFDPYLTFRCSSDRRAIVGHINTHRRLLEAGLPPQRVIVEAPKSSIVDPYDLSPDGQYVAYVTNALCVENNGKDLGCVQGWGIYPQKISVSNSGAVIFDAGTGETCYLDAAGNFSLKSLPGYDDVEECIGVSSWRPGDKRSQVLERLGRNPQWITPQAAAALRAWRDYTQGAEKTYIKPAPAGASMKGAARQDLLYHPRGSGGSWQAQ